MKQTTVLAPVIDLKRGGPSEERQVIDTPPHPAAGLKVNLRSYIVYSMYLNLFNYFKQVRCWVLLSGDI